MRAKTREKDTYFEAGIAQSLENRGNLWKKLTNWNLSLYSNPIADLTMRIFSVPIRYSKRINATSGAV